MLCPVAKSALRRSSASSSALVRPRVRVTAPRPPPTFSSSPHQRHAFETSAPSTSPSGGTNTISQAEIEHFSALSANWWDPTGEFGLLHRMNPARLDFLRDELLRVDELEGARWLQGKDVLDVGCGGGIFAESLARLGANTTAIDAAAQNITMAQTHAALDPSLHVINSPIPSRGSRRAKSTSRNTLEYRHCAAEDLVREGKRFDVVCAMEVVEHVEDPRGFLECLMQLTKPGGHLLLSTISRTPLARLLTITLAEDVLRLVTPGTHTYHKYIKPQELADFFAEKGWIGFESRGCPYDPIAGKWRLLGLGETGGLGQLVNYFASVRRPLQ
ncbi:S-adenosyl-L-methionine-dependent methyltransferase [Rhodotorula diobovata]|uniref:Ubiquinone biosynthesis O-methyltransferase, mitochondrial n=1 Tax=Rhodotorula diobovata TaxID=5288 RepID=A0A5C5FXK5_9BASI|nr:S-adenosyl-L-methionine-dependent methyltransferase [Rhodotorula diobovata]